MNRRGNCGEICLATTNSARNLTRFEKVLEI
jgi:hypothetical protein